LAILKSISLNFAGALFFKSYAPLENFPPRVFAISLPKQQSSRFLSFDISLVFGHNDEPKFDQLQIAAIGSNIQRSN
jgi:hypothetical protein